VVDIGYLDGRDEDHRRLLEPRMFADHGGEFEAVEFGHADVQQDHGDVVLEQAFQRFAAGRRHQQGLAQLAQDHLIRQQLGRLIVDQEDVDLVVLPHRAHP